MWRSFAVDFFWFAIESENLRTRVTLGWRIVSNIAYCIPVDHYQIVKVTARACHTCDRTRFGLFHHVVAAQSQLSEFG